MQPERKDFCNACGQEIPAGVQGPCPHCHASSGRRTDLHLHGEIRPVGSVEATRYREYYEQHPAVKWTVTAITVVGAFGGLVVSGWPGVVAGLVLGGVSYFL